MPSAPRPSKKSMKIVFDILGKPSNYIDIKTKKDERADRIIFQNNIRLSR